VSSNPRASTEPTDAELVVRIGTGDSGAFETLVTRHHARVFRLAARVLGDSGAAEDMIQEAFIKLWTGKARFDPARGAFAGWFGRIVVNQCLDQRRAFKVVAPLDDAAGLADPTPDPEQAAHQGEQADRLDGALATLPLRQRAALTLFYGEGHSMAETASLLDLSVKAVESLLSRGRSALKERLLPLREEV